MHGLTRASRAGVLGQPLRGVKVGRPNQVWGRDITYIPMARGFVYLVAVVDWFTRRVLSHRVSITMEAGFCIEALEEAIGQAEGADGGGADPLRSL
jgi:transposase InsO family protein